LLLIPNANQHKTDVISATVRLWPLIHMPNTATATTGNTVLNWI